jgi:hypothetical protein
MAMQMRALCDGPAGFRLRVGAPISTRRAAQIGHVLFNLTHALQHLTFYIHVTVRQDDNASLFSPFTATRAGQCWLALETRANGNQRLWIA